MNGWRRHGWGSRIRMVATLDPREAGLLRGLVEQVLGMLTEREQAAPKDDLVELTGIRTGPSKPPADQVLARLLPDFHREDAELAGALRSVREPELIEAKSAAAGVLLETCPPDGGRIELDVEQADAWLAALNDVRLALGTTLGVTEDMPESPPEDETVAAHLGAYQWLTFVQDALVQARATAL
ncbi:MAG: DUF2017 domain-containing protein [Actinomycetota bacterium]|nr:DUF2017 domain-containing protein [Actinomycetota bacterium]